MSAAEQSPKKGVIKSARITEFIGDIGLFYPILVECVLDRTDAPQDEKDKPERFYDSVIRLVEQTDDDKLSGAVCDFSAGHKLKEVKLIEIKATYFVAVYHPKGLEFPLADRKNLLDQLVKASAWPLFRDLFIHIGSQTGAELPLLPNVPKLRWLKADTEEATAVSSPPT